MLVRKDDNSLKIVSIFLKIKCYYYMIFKVRMIFKELADKEVRDYMWNKNIKCNSVLRNKHLFPF